MNRRLIILGGLFLVLFLVVVVVPPEAGQQPPLTVYSAQEGGGKALRLWLEALGYEVTTLESEPYTVPRNVGTVLLLSPTTSLGSTPLVELERWVRQGGRLVVAEDGFSARPLLRRFDVTMGAVADVEQAVPAAPGLLDPQLQAITVRPRFRVLTSDRLEPLLVGERPSAPEGEQRPVLAARLSVERGQLIVLSAPELFSNGGLRTEANARLALSLIGPAASAGRIAFDELHHGYGRAQPRTTFSLLLEQAWGRLALWSGVIVLLFLLWRGRRFGRAVPVFIDRGRSLGELVTSQAALLRAGGKRRFVADHLARRIRHDLAEAVGLPATASDAEIAAHAATLGRDPARALSVLARIERARSDRALLHLAREGEEARADLTRAVSPSLTATGSRDDR